MIDVPFCSNLGLTECVLMWLLVLMLVRARTRCCKSCGLIVQERLLGLVGAGLLLVLAPTSSSHDIFQERCSEETKSDLKTF